MFQPLDDHLDRIWRFIAWHKQEHDGRSPSYAEIAKAIGIPSKDHVKRDLEKLVALKFIRLVRNMARGIELLKLPDEFLRTDTVRVPLMGTISAGFKFATPDDNSVPQEWVQVARHLVGNRQSTYLLRVSGHSMIDALVNDGDLVLMEATTIANNGDMVAVWLKRRQSMTLKKIFFKGNKVVLRPANPTLQEKAYKPRDIQVQGKVLCIIRNTQNQVLERAIQVA